MALFPTAKPEILIGMRNSPRQLIPAPVRRPRSSLDFSEFTQEMQPPLPR